MILELRNIEKSFGTKHVLKGISFAAESGKAFGLLGRNGAGKTTSIRILMDVFHADSGEVLLDGKPIDYSSLKIGYLPEERGLYPKKRIIDQLVYFAELNGLSHANAVSSADKWLMRLDMYEYRNKRLDTLSKGNQQKIQLITALAHDPQIVVLDEPFSGLDPVNARLLKNVVKETIAEDKIVIFSSHQMNYIEEFCDSIAIINDGQVVLGGDLHSIKRSYIRNRLLVCTEQPERVKAEMKDMYCCDENGALIIQIPPTEDKKSVMARLINTCDVDSIGVYEPSLNDIFVEYTDTAKGEQ